ncbi:MAG: hypothetical protein RJA70_3800 [Pseudomonadota bacterium]|jgi:hypothetical protein
MPPFKRHFVLLLISLLCAGVSRPCIAGVSASEAARAVQSAEQAHQELQFDATRRLAQSALEQGSQSPSTVERLWYLIAVASAALDDADGAKQAFTRVLLLNPATVLDPGLSPKLRSPFMEAKGEASPRDRLDVALSLDPAAGGARLRVSDRAAWAKSAELHARVSPTSPFTRWTVQLRDQSAFFPVAGVDSYLQYFLVVLDEHDNQLLTLGSAQAPAEHGKYPSPPTTSSVRATELLRAEPTATSATPYLVVGWTLFGLGVGAAGTAVPYHLQREDRALLWNSTACEKPGSLARGDQCEQIDRERARAQRLATLLYASGAGLALVGVVTLGLAPSESRESTESPETALNVGCGLGYLALVCDGAF